MFIIRAPRWEETWLVSRLIIFPATHNSENFYRKNNLLVFVKTNSALECDQPDERKTPTQRRPTAENTNNENTSYENTYHGNSSFKAQTTEILTKKKPTTEILKHQPSKGQLLALPFLYPVCVFKSAIHLGSLA